MPAYSIEKKGADFVVRAGQQDILKFATKRQAVQMIRDARTLEASRPCSAEVPASAA